MNIKWVSLILLILTTLILISTLRKENSQSESSYPPINYSQSSTVINNNSNFNISYQSHQNQPALKRDSILRKSVKGYREQIYWGGEHPINEKVRQMDDDKFKEFIEDEIQSKNSDIYWGAEY
jgi:hypothetical protein